MAVAVSDATTHGTEGGRVNVSAAKKTRIAMPVFVLLVSQVAWVGVGAATRRPRQSRDALQEETTDANETVSVHGGADGGAVAAGATDANASSSQERETSSDGGTASIREVEPDKTVTKEVPYDPEYAVEFSSGSFTPKPGLDPAVTDTDHERVPVLVQFYASPYASTFEKLSADGYRDVGQLSWTTRYATVPAGQAETIANAESVRAVTAIRPAWKMRPSFREELDAADGALPVVVQTFEPLPESTVEGMELSRVETDDAGVTTYFGQATASDARDLRQASRVMWVAKHVRPEPADAEGNALVGGNMARSPGPAAQSGYTGKGVRVGVVDSGIEHSHHHFSSTTVIDSKDWYGSRPTKPDFDPEAHGNCDHGTYVSGIIAGRGYDPNRDRTVRGVAPNATLVETNVYKPDGPDPGPQCDWMNKPVGLKKIFGTVDEKNVDVISNSWGRDSGGDYTYEARRSDTWAKNNPDTLLVFANGNAPGDDYVITPALGKNGISVGAITDGSDGNVTDKSIRNAGDSSSLNQLKPPTDARKGSGRKKPELYAPGESITSSELGDKYEAHMGSSAAAPYVAGSAALVKEKYPQMSANHLRADLIGSAVAPRYDGYGVVNANNALFENAYESRHAHMSGSVAKVRAIPVTKGAKRQKKRIQTDVKTVDVTQDTKRMVVTLTWLDPGNLVASKSNRLSNKLNLVVDGPGVHRTVTTDSNVKQVVVDDPAKGTWAFEFRARHVTLGTNQNYDLVYRTVTKDPTLSVDDSRNVTVKPWESRDQRVEFNVTGTGAPVSGVTVDADTDRGLSSCGKWRENSVAGILSQGHTHTEHACIHVPQTGHERNFTFDFTVRTKNAERIDGTRTRNVTRSVTFNVLPHPKRDRFESRYSGNDDPESVPRLVKYDPKFDWQHGHLRCVAGGRFSAGKSPGDDCSDILHGGTEAAASENWRIRVPQLSLHSDADTDSYRFILPRRDIWALTGTNYECGSQTITAGGKSYEVKTRGRLVIKIESVRNKLGDAPVKVDAAKTPLTLYDGDGNELSYGATESPYGYTLTRTVGCPKTKKHDREFTVVFGNGSTRNIGTYRIEISYVVDVTRPDRIERLKRQMGIQHEAAKRAERKAERYGDLGLPRGYDDRLGESLGCPGSYNCGGDAGPLTRLVANERVLIHVRNARGEESNRYLVTMSDGRVTKAREVTGETEVTHSVDAYTDVTTTRWVVQSDDKTEAINGAYQNGQLRIEGNGPGNAIKFGALKVGVDVLSAVTGAADAVDGLLP